MNQPTSETKRAAPVTLRPAATVLLLREDAGKLEIVMMRRPSTMAFMADVWVFPGGGQDPVDTTHLVARTRGPGAASHCNLRDPTGEPLSEERALGLMITACRETFEEAGILLARRDDDSAASPEAIARALQHRAEITEQPHKLVGLLEAEGLLFDVERLVYWSHWITPPFEKRRFDTRFFAIEVASDQCAICGSGESTELEWLEPTAVLEAHQRGTMKLMPPTLITLEDLLLSYQAHGSVSAMLAAEARRITPPLMPKLLPQGGMVRSVMPWDATYASLPGEGYEQSVIGHYSRLRSQLEFRIPTIAQ